MKGIEALIKIHGFELDEKRRALKALTETEAEIEAAIEGLEAEVLREQQAARASVEGTYAYGHYASAVIERRAALHKSLEMVRRQIDEARDAVALAFETLKKYELTKTARDRQAATEALRRERILLDELGLNAHERNKAG